MSQFLCLSVLPGMVRNIAAKFELSEAGGGATRGRARLLAACSNLWPGLRPFPNNERSMFGFGG